MLQQSLASAAKDLVDSTATTIMATSPTLSGFSVGSSSAGIKERTISVTSVAEVEEEAENMDDRSCYLSADESNMESTNSNLELETSQIQQSKVKVKITDETGDKSKTE